MFLAAESVALFTIDAAIATVVVGSLLPILVGIVTKLNAPSWLKAVLHALLAAVSGLLITSQTIDGQAVISKEGVVVAFSTWVVGMAVYFGFLVPTRISPTVNDITKDFGLGPASEP